VTKMFLEKREAVTVAVIGAMLFAGLLVYPSAPETIPVHWNASGQADGFGPKLLGLFAIPVFVLFLYAMFAAIPFLDPYKKNFQQFKNEYFCLKLGIILFFACLYAGMLYYSLVGQFNFNYLMIPLLAGLFYLLGVLMPRFKRNFFVGIRTPWTLASETVWDKTHKVGGRLFKAAAFLSLAGLLFGDSAVWVAIASILVASLVTVVYSFLKFRKEERRSQSPRRRK